MKVSAIVPHIPRFNATGTPYILLSSPQIRVTSYWNLVDAPSTRVVFTAPGVTAASTGPQATGSLEAQARCCPLTLSRTPFVVEAAQEAAGEALPPGGHRSPHKMAAEDRVP